MLATQGFGRCAGCSDTVTEAPAAIPRSTWKAKRRVAGSEPPWIAPERMAVDTVTVTLSRDTRRQEMPGMWGVCQGEKQATTRRASLRERPHGLQQRDHPSPSEPESCHLRPRYGTWRSRVRWFPFWFQPASVSPYSPLSRSPLWKGLSWKHVTSLLFL